MSRSEKREKGEKEGEGKLPSHLSPSRQWQTVGKEGRGGGGRGEKGHVFSSYNSFLTTALITELG